MCNIYFHSKPTNHNSDNNIKIVPLSILSNINWSFVLKDYGECILDHNLEIRISKSLKAVQ